MAYLIRTFRDPIKSGEHITVQDDDKEHNSYDTDTGIVFPQNGKSVLNNAGYDAHAAVGFADPLFSLFPVSTNDYYDKSVDDTVKRLVEQYGDYYEALPSLLKRGSLKQAIEYANKVKSDTAKMYGFGEDDWGDFVEAELKKDFPLKEKNKYSRLLNNLRSYGPYHNDPNEYLKDPEYDRPQHALIEAKVDNIYKSADKVERKSAESDGPNEYRVKDYTVRGLWTPRQVDSVIKKYYPDYVPGRFGKLDTDESRSKDALDEIISMDSNNILSDRRVKSVIKDMNSILNSTYIGNIASIVNRRY